VGARKVKIEKNWWDVDPKKFKESARKVHKFEQMTVLRSEDLPELITQKKAAEILNRHYRTIEEYRNEGSLQFKKMRGRYYTTPEWIAEFIEAEWAKK
jgi:hypothetical protein